MLMELKSKGYLISRYLSLKNAEVRMAACGENQDFAIVYTFCANLVSKDL